VPDCSFGPLSAVPLARALSFPSRNGAVRENTSFVDVMYLGKVCRLLGWAGLGWVGSGSTTTAAPAGGVGKSRPTIPGVRSRSGEDIPFFSKAALVTLGLISLDASKQVRW